MHTHGSEYGSEPAPGYRWVVVFASAAILALAMGIMVNGISVFFAPLQEEFAWQRGSISFINFSGLLGLAAGGVVVGRVADNADIRKICLTGAAVLGMCMLLSARAEALWQFYVLFFFAGFLGAGALFAPIIANVGNWFPTGAGLAVGIASAGQALGQGGVPFGTANLISSFGWRGAFVALGLLAIFLLVPLALLIRNPPLAIRARDAGETGRSDASPVSLSTPTVTIWLSAAVVCCCTCMSVPLMHLVPLIQDRGFSAEQASSVAFLMLSVAILGRIAFGKLADMIGALPAYLVASFWQTALVFFFTTFASLNGFYAFAVIFGFGYAGVMTCLLLSVRALTPVSKRASTLGIVLVFAWLGHGIGGYQGGVFFDLTGEYSQSYANAAIAGVFNLIIVFTLYLRVSRPRRDPLLTT